MSQALPINSVGLRPPSGVALRTVLDLSSQVLCVCDLSGDVVWCNVGFERTLGYSSGEVIGQRLIELADDDGRSSLERAGVPDGGGDRLTSPEGRDEADRESPVDGLRGEEVAGALARMRRRTSGWRWVDWTVRVDRRRRLVFVAGRDVTERLAAEDAVRAAEARLRAIVSHSPSGIFVKDLEGRYLLANEAWARLTGSKPEDTVGRTDDEIQPVNVAHLLCLEDQLASSSSASGDLQIETPAGPRDLMVSLSALCEDDGRRYAMCGIATDITDRKQAEAALSERERLLDTVLSTSPDIIALLDKSGRIQHISSAEQLILGYRHPQPSDAEIFSRVHPEDFDQLASAFIAMVTGSRSQLHLRYRIRHDEGRWVTVESRAQAVVDDAGGFMGAVVVTRDVSDRLDSERRLQALRQAAEQASRAKSDFLSRMSHEMRTPLNAILGFSQLLQMDELPVQQSEAVDHILRAGRHLLELIDEVLDIARIEAGHLELAPRAVPLAEVVSDAIDSTRRMAERAEVTVQSDLDQKRGLAVLADRQRFSQVVLNLISNAVKYNRPGGRVDVSAEPTSEGRVGLTVADTGRGIRPEHIDRVFEPFDRLGAQQAGVAGTGVGLALTKHLVERMNGTVQVDSVLDVGSTFIVDLPMAVLPDRARLASGRRQGAGTTDAASFWVLLAEECLESLELVERVLARRPGVAVMAAKSGREALDLAREQQPELIIIDLELPDIPGSSVLAQLAEDPHTTDIPVAVLSTQSEGSQLRRLLGRGVAGQLTKPIDVRALLSLVDAARAATGR